MTRPRASDLGDADFREVSDYLASAAGLVFDESRRPVLAGILAERLRLTGAGSVPAYLALLDRAEGEAERGRLLDAVTVQETQFFRNPHQMEALRRRIVPELLRRCAGRARPLTIWSAGCSTGEEAYTLAMLLLELAPGLAGTAGARILGTDVSAEALRTARRATYAGRSLDAVPAGVRDRWFENRPDGGLAVRPEVRRLVELRPHNLVTERPPFGAGEVDLVVCRNVTIYFSRDTTRLLIGGFHDVLAEGGYLLIGHSETLWQVSDAFSLMTVDDAFFYRRTYDARGSARATRGRSARAVEPRLPAGPPRAARRTLPPVVPAAPTPQPTDGPALLAHAREALGAGDYASAVSRSEDAVRAEPLLGEAYVVQGHALSSLGRDASAVDPLRKAVYLDPGAGHAHFLLAGALARLGQTAQAAVSYRAAAKAFPRVDPGALEAVLHGRDVADLVALCFRLADICEAEPGRFPAALSAERSAS